MRTLLRNRAVLSLSLGHMAVDVLNSAVPVLLAALATQVGLSNVALGTVATAYSLAASLTQPLFGLAADRWETRWLGAGALLWMAGGFVVAALLPGTAALPVLVVAALGSGAYHPQATMNARLAAGERAGGGTSLFFFFGQTGLALGPALSGILLARLSLEMTIAVLATLTVPVILLLARHAPYSARFPATSGETAAESSRHRISWGPLSLTAFALVLVFRGWPPAATNTFLPKWLADAGFAPQEFGGLLALFMFGSALGNVLGGWLSDRWSRKAVVVAGLALAAPPFFVLYLTPSAGPLAAGATALAGLATGMPHSVMVLMAQNLFPKRMGFGSGLVLGFMFSAGAAAGWLTGWLADRTSLQEALALTPWVCLAGALCALALPRTRAPGSLPAPVVAADEAGGRAPGVAAK